MAACAGASPIAAAGALVVLYVCGYVVGALVVDAVDALSLAVIRTLAGLLLTTIGFLLSLVLSVPWFLGPGVLVALALWRVPGAPAVPAMLPGFRLDGLVAGILASVILSPIAITFVHMAPGAFPPVFYNIDTAYFLEKVHALASTNGYPPPSLSNLGIARTYHYGTQAMAALISRSSGLLPHHALFLVVLPLLAAGVMAAAVAAARFLSPALPRSVTVPALLIASPSLSNSFWSGFGPGIWTDYGQWGFLSNEGPNISGDFLVVASVAGIAAAPALGWGGCRPC